MSIWLVWRGSRKVHRWHGRPLIREAEAKVIASRRWPFHHLYRFKVKDGVSRQRWTVIGCIPVEVRVLIRKMIMHHLHLHSLSLGRMTDISIELRLAMLLVVDQTRRLVLCRTERRHLDLRNRAWASGIHSLTCFGVKRSRGTSVVDGL